MEIFTSLLPREVRAPMAVAGVLLSGALFEFVPELGGQRRVEAGMSFAGALPPARIAIPARVEPAAPAPEEARKAPLSLDEFIGLLHKKTPPPVARAFAKAFMKEPSLRKVWEDHTRSRGGKGPARDFLRQVAALPRFRQLANQFKSHGGSQAAFAQLARDPGVNELLRDAVGGGAALASAPANPAGRPPTFDEARQGSLQSASASARQSAAIAQNRSGPLDADSKRSNFLAASPAANGARDSSPSASPGSSLGGSSQTGASATGGGSPAEGTSDPGASGGSDDATTDLRSLSSAGDSREAASYLDGIFATAPAWLRETLQAQCEQNDALCDPVSACLAANVYDECVEACRANPACGGQISTIFEGEANEVIPGQTSGRPDSTIQDGWMVSFLSEPNGSQKGLGDTPEPPPVTVQPAEPPADNGENWAFGGEVVGGLLGTIAGGLIGTAIGGPMGTLIGGAIGGAIGATAGNVLGDLVGGFF